MAWNILKSNNNVTLEEITSPDDMSKLYRVRSKRTPEDIFIPSGDLQAAEKAYAAEVKLCS